MRTNLSHAEVERRSGEVARRGQPEILIEILPDCLLAAQAKLLLAIFKPVIDAPHIERYMLA